MKKTGFKYPNIFIVLVSFICFSFLSGFLSVQTTNGKIDYLAYKLNDYNKFTINNNFIRPYVRIESKSKKDDLYDDLFKQFYYSDDSGSIRQIMANDFEISVNGFQKNINLFSQNTFSISTSIAADGGYRIDYGVFHSYFSDKELGTRSYLGPHFNCNSYIFVSDIFADYLLDCYGLEKNENSYLNLINEEQYSVLRIKVDKTQELTFSINNILYSTKRTGPRCSEFSPYFGLINFRYVSQYIQPAFEIDLKSYAYYISSVLNKCESMGYTVDSFDYKFYKYDRDNKLYVERPQLGEEYYSIRHNEYDLLFSVLFYLTLVVSAVSIYIISRIFLKRTNDAIITLFLLFLLLLVYSIIANTIYVSYFFSLSPLMMLTSYFIAKGGAYHEKINQFFQEKHLDRKSFFEIEI